MKNFMPNKTHTYYHSFPIIKNTNITQKIIHAMFSGVFPSGFLCSPLKRKPHFSRDHRMNSKIMCHCANSWRGGICSKLWKRDFEISVHLVYEKKGKGPKAHVDVRNLVGVCSLFWREITQLVYVCVITRGISKCERLLCYLMGMLSWKTKQCE